MGINGMAKISADRRPKALAPDTESKIKKILESISLGVPYKIAVEANGLSETHFYNWIKQGLCDIAADKETPQSKMVVSLRKIEQKDMADSLEKIKHAEKGHRGAEWYLEKRHWKYFGQNVGVVELGEQMDEMKRLLAEQKK